MRKVSSPRSVRFAFASIVALLLASASGSAGAETLYGVTGTHGQPSTLYKIDPTTGAPLSIVGTLADPAADGGGVGFVVTGLRRNPKTGVMYGTTCAHSGPLLADGGDSRGALITIDLTTGKGTYVGSLTTNDSDPMADLAINPDGGNAYGWLEGPDLYSLIDLGAGTSSQDFDAHFPANTEGSGMIFDNSGHLLYAGFNTSGRISVLDPATGLEVSSTPIVGDGRNIGSLAMNHAGQLFGVAIDDGVSSLVRFDSVTDAGADSGIDGGAYITKVLGDTAYGELDGGDAGPPAIALSAITFNLDQDDDGVVDDLDNCPDTANPDQADSNHNSIGDACERAGSGDAGKPTDGGLGAKDASTGSADGGGLAADGNGGDSGGCGCGVVGAEDASGLSALAFMTFAGIQIVSRRRRRARRG